MIYLRTGANGTGKTLLTLRDVREKSIKENRPVYHNGRFEIVEGGPLDSWKKIDFKDWQSVPDGAIFIVDECHNELPTGGAKDGVPEYIKALAEHRRRGFDFYLITQHPMNLHPFVRRLIGAPGWHQHLKRASGAQLVALLEWPAVNDQPQRNGSGASAAVSMVPYPKEVYSWYRSASLNTAKTKIPFQVKVLAACFILIPLMAYFGWQGMQKVVSGKKPEIASMVPGAPGSVVPAPPGQLADKPVITTTQLLASYTPRIPGLPQTAPRYDEVTKPTIAPVPAACVSMGNRCDCFTQQGTKLQTPADLCKQIVAGGFFMDWEQGGTGGARGVPALPATPAGAPAGSAAPMAGNPGASPAVAIAELKQETQNVGDLQTLSSMRIGKRLLN